MVFIKIFTLIGVRPGILTALGMGFVWDSFFGISPSRIITIEVSTPEFGSFWFSSFRGWGLTFDALKLLEIFGSDPDFSCKMYLANLDLAGGSQIVCFPGYSLAVEIFSS